MAKIHNTTTTIRRECYISEIPDLPHELAFTLEEYSSSGDVLRPSDNSRTILAVWGDSFHIYEIPEGGYKIRIYKHKNLISIIHFDSLGDLRKDKSLGGTIDVYSEESCYDIDVITSRVAEVPLHAFPENDKVHHF